MMLIIEKFILSHSKKHRTFSEVCKDMIVDNEVIFHAEARWLSRGKVLERVFDLWQVLRVFLSQQGYPMSTDFQGTFWFYLNLNSLQ